MVKVSNIYSNFCRGVLGQTDMFVSSILWGKQLSPPKKVPWRVPQLFSKGKSCVNCRHFSPLLYQPRIFGTTTCAVHNKPLEVRSHAQARKSRAKRPISRDWRTIMVSRSASLLCYKTLHKILRSMSLVGGKVADTLRESPAAFG